MKLAAPTLADHVPAAYLTWTLGVDGLLERQFQDIVKPETNIRDAGQNRQAGGSLSRLRDGSSPDRAGNNPNSSRLREACGSTRGLDYSDGKKDKLDLGQVLRANTIDLTSVLEFRRAFEFLATSA